MLRNLHHANLLIGTPVEGESYLQTLSVGLQVRLENNPDFVVFRMETFGINEARALSLSATRKALTRQKIFLITSDYLTLEAQNALLKTFEDPFPETYFFLVSRNESQIVPTLRSRMQIFHVPRLETQLSHDVEVFLSSSLKDRLLFVKEFMDQEKNMIIFLDNLLLALRKKGDRQMFMKRVYAMRLVAEHSGVATRLIMEHLSVVLQ